MNAKIKAFGIVVIIMTPLLLFINASTEPHVAPVAANIPDTKQDINLSNARIIIDQKELTLNHEVIQYKIIFHENDTINVSASLLLQQTGKDFDPMACLFILTNGTDSIFEKSKISFLYNVPSGILFDTTILGHRITFGGKFFFKLLEHTRYRMGVYTQLYQDAQVKKGEIWYLTLANFKSKPTDMLKIALTSKSSSASMELVQVDRHSNVGFYSALDNDFEGQYMGFKIPFLPFGFSIAKSLHKEIITSRGSVVYFCSVGHAKGRIKVNAPNNKTYLNINDEIALFSYCGNLTGSWNFYASGFGFPWKHAVLLFYADIDPHLKMKTD